MAHKMHVSRSGEAPFMSRIEFCPNGIVHLSYGATTLHFPVLEFLRLMAAGEETVERIRCTMEGVWGTGIVH